MAGARRVPRTVPAVAREGAPLIARVFAQLADARFHSGEELAQALGVSRSAIWKATRSLSELGAALHAVRNRGYRLAAGGEPLDAARIRELLKREVRAHVASVEAAWSIPSTNTALLERANPANGTSEILLAEHQSAGRGRRGRAWLAPPGGAICLSLSWTFREVPQDLGALSLVIGVCGLRVLRELGVAGAALKWPNDLLVGERKLGGVLIELRAESSGPACVVVGIGLNVALGEALLEQIAQSGTAATDLASTGLTGISRNAVVAALVTGCVRGLVQFEREGLKPFIEEWRAADALRGRPVNVSVGDRTTKGLARGVDLHGALLVETPQGVKRFIAGDVTVRS
jgi:BirA family transcriptional regulator, biotin operon repressor / biotin---[acetyl-CoA-carboxylase] ligase